MSNEFKIDRNHEHLQEGDYVVGRYSSSGQVLKAGALNGDPIEIQEVQQSVLNNAAKVRGVEIKKRGRPKKSVNVEEPDIIPLTPAVTLKELESEYYEYEEVEKPITPIRSIELHNDFGRIKLFVEEVIEIDIAFMLVFKSSTDLIFIPAPGQTLNFTYNENNYQVYYADTVFPWIDHKKQLMILFKKDDN